MKQLSVLVSYYFLNKVTVILSSVFKTWYKYADALAIRKYTTHPYEHAHLQTVEQANSKNYRVTTRVSLSALSTYGVRCLLPNDE